MADKEVIRPTIKKSIVQPTSTKGFNRGLSYIKYIYGGFDGFTTSRAGLDLTNIPKLRHKMFGKLTGSDDD